MKTSIEFVNHASVIIKGAGVSVLSDPWFTGDVFHKGWNLLQETSDEDVENILSEITHIWISHEHPDHFSIPFFKKFRQKIINSSITILFQETADKRVLNFLKGQSLSCIELRFSHPEYLTDDFSVTCIKDGFYDSGLLVENDGERILNLNDCEVTNVTRANEVKVITGEVDVLLTQFSFAAWKGGKENKKWRDEASKEKLNTMALQIEIFKPKFVIPFASFVYFSNYENVYLNDAVNKPSDILRVFSESLSKIIIMQPKDVLGGIAKKISNDKSVEFWEKKYQYVNCKCLNEYDIVPIEQIKKSFSSYCQRIEKNNSLWFIKMLRAVSPISAFNPVTVSVSDLGSVLQFDYVSKKISYTTKDPMLSMRSESLDFLFKNSFGFDTLTVNGCFEEGKKGGFVYATKTLAIENLNNLGINISPSLLVNFSIIKLFLTRLYRVAKKLDS